MGIITQTPKARQLQPLTLGQELVIPLPCSCDDVDGMKVVHYGHVVPMGSTVQQIANDYGTNESVLLSLNGLADANDLKAGAVLDVPLKACTSMISNNSLDYPLLVPNGTYTFTANNCVRCKCDASNNMTLQCEPSPKEVKITKWIQCPSMQCESPVTLSLGNTSSSSGCVQACAYAGYYNQTILTTPMTVSGCQTSGAGQPSGNDASKISLRGWCWTLLFVSLQLGSLLW
ncbi:hypothetical protein IFM89_010118 [Coptis chinensis]|uniref:LysM domain-containing protein n=1 Tax=Coptis chinensis TaxID=261450 RepID=A0A835LUF5_9MAGN|nr:hypothetical protein IFM89_010118 [Coptis chinensis]